MVLALSPFYREYDCRSSSGHIIELILYIFGKYKSPSHDDSKALLNKC